MNHVLPRVTLTAQQQMDLTRAIQTMEALYTQLADLESCGKDCDAERVAIQIARQRAQALLNKFSPHTTADQ